MAVSSVTDSRASETLCGADIDRLVAWAPQYPAAEFVTAAAAAVASMSASPDWAGVAPEGPAWFLKVSAGRLRVGSVDLARGQRSDARAYVRQERDRDYLKSEVGCEVTPLAPRSIISEWSAASRARMVERLSTLDYQSVWGERPPAMVTLTLPAEWWAYAPSGPEWKRLLRRFYERYTRAWGGRPVGLWKQEFQRRGAPHLHMLITLPLGKDRVAGLPWAEWLPQAWADSIGVAGLEREKVVAVHSHRLAYGDYAEGVRASDPRRVAIYFLKHGSFSAKEYQNQAPDLWAGTSVGRFWGYWGLRVVSVVARLTGAEARVILRTLRRWNRANNGRTVFRRRRPGSRRWVTYRKDRLTGRAGFLVLNDAASMAIGLADLLATGAGLQAERAPRPSPGAPATR